MSRKQRVLMELRTAGSGLLQAAETESKETMGAAARALAATRDLCRQGLPESSYARYSEVFDGLILITQKMSESEDTDIEKDMLALCQELLRSLIREVEGETGFKKDIFFLPYKASMWDSLESVWKAANEDKEHCNAYVMPIPYADKNPDGSVAEWHCEREEFPPDVPTWNWQEIDLQEIHPDIIFIHTPYDNMNLVTSVESRYYSFHLKPCTDCLVYIPYYATAGGMADAQTMCPAYLHVDYIVTQSEKFRKFFDASLPDEKFLPFGSPKFDKVIRLCQNPPEPPEEWKEKLQGRKVYFYNTSLNGFLDCVPLFLQKMQYVFDIFRDRKDACLLWRPHPLLESTLKSMRPEFIPDFERLRDAYIAEDFGIYDTTPDIEKTIALSDAYIGDGGTSVTSLFGMAGKPVFYLNNMIHRLPGKDDWLGHVNRVWNYIPRNWLMPYGNQLWHSQPGDDLHFHHCLDLSPYGGGGFYGSLLELGDKLYVCPNNAQDILVVEDGKVTRKIPLERKMERAEAFAGAAYLYQENEDYFFLMPMRYPAVVRYDFRHDRLDYAECPNDIFCREANNEKWRGAVFFREDWLIFGSPVDAQGFAVHRHTLETKQMTLCHPGFGGSMAVLLREWGDDEYFFLPYAGRKVTRWNMRTGEVQEYDFPEGFKCHHPTRGYECDIRPFANGIFQDENTILLAPLWGNMFAKLHIDTGVMEEWKTPFEVTPEGKNEYFFAGSTGYFIAEPDLETKTWRPKSYQFYYTPERKRYQFDPKTEEFTPLEQDTVIDETEMRKHVPGFCEMSEHDAYGCWEDVFNSLKDFVDGNISGAQFDRERQLAAYRNIAANNDGTAGEKIYRFLMDKISERKG